MNQWTKPFKLAYTRQWFKDNPDKIAIYDARYKDQRRLNRRRRYQVIRLAAIKALGSRCSSKNCRWINADGSKGCTDTRILQVDHKKGNGTQERKTLTAEQIWLKAIQAKKGEYQLLCANCNWLKAHTNKEFTQYNPKKKEVA